jgi:hypothetical protein
LCGSDHLLSLPENQFLYFGRTVHVVDIDLKGQHVPQLFRIPLVVALSRDG